MHSIRTKITLMTVIVMIIVMTVAAVSGVIAIKKVGSKSANQILLLLCESGEKNLDYYFDSVEHSVEMVSTYVSADINGTDDKNLGEHLDRVRDIFNKITLKTNGVLTYYYRIDPTISKNVKGFWYVQDSDTGRFTEHEVTDITQYDTTDTSQLVWFTVPKATGKSCWLPPYVTENLGVRVISYNVPVYYHETFVGVIGIEIDYTIMADQVNNITLFNSGYAFINDAEGFIIYHPHISPEELAVNHPKIPEGLISPKENVNYTFEGVEKQAVWLELHNGMRLNVSVPVSEINAQWHNWTNQIVIIFVSLLVIFIGIIVTFTEHITKPLRNLAKVAEEIDKGNYDHDLSYKGKDEVGTLTESFKKLTDHLRVYISDLNDLAYVDALTSLHNKGAFNASIENLQTEINENEEVKFSVFVFDCNGLKAINDKYGHDKGDIYLKEAANTISEVFKDTQMFRIGGDEFAVIITEKDYNDCVELLKEFDLKCDKINDKTTDPWKKVDIARGMAYYNKNDDSTVSDVVRRADRLMYENKWEHKKNQK